MSERLQVGIIPDQKLLEVKIRQARYILESKSTARTITTTRSRFFNYNVFWPHHTSVPNLGLKNNPRNLRVDIPNL